MEKGGRVCLLIYRPMICFWLLSRSFDSNLFKLIQIRSFQQDLHNRQYALCLTSSSAHWHNLSWMSSKPRWVGNPIFICGCRCRRQSPGTKLSAGDYSLFSRGKAGAVMFCVWCGFRKYNVFAPYQTITVFLPLTHINVRGHHHTIP